MALFSAFFLKILIPFHQVTSGFIQASLRKPPALLTVSVIASNGKGTLSVSIASSTLPPDDSSLLSDALWKDEVRAWLI